MIQNEQYQKMIAKMQEAQQFDAPCVLLYVERNIDESGDEVNRLNWVTATNSAYETLGMVMRGVDLLNVRTTYIAGGNLDEH